jgi:hypothetical protein
VSNTSKYSDEILTARFTQFLFEIGIPFEYADVAGPTFLPGIAVVSGGLVLDRSGLLYPGDILHEAGHLAIAPAEIRSSLTGEVVIPDELPGTVEAAAMCWSYAACIHLEVDPGVVFHEHGYHGRSQGLLQNFALGVFPGVHTLQTFGMTVTSGDPSTRFPVMMRWLRA